MNKLHPCPKQHGKKLFMKILQKGAVVLTKKQRNPEGVFDGMVQQYF
jgi:hypothetical protein